MDYEKLASEVLQALRARRSQNAFSKRLGYSSNVAYLWESGRTFPRASRFFQVAARCSKPAEAILLHFYRHKPDWLRAASPTTSQGIAAFLCDLKGKRATLNIAQTTGLSRFAIARWLKAAAEPRLPDFLRMLDALSLRLLDFLEGLVDPAHLDSVADSWQRLQSARRTAYEAPWSHAVLRALEIESYRALKRHVPGWLARQTGLTLEQEQLSLKLLSDAGQIRRQRGRWQLVESMAVDTRNDPAGALRLREFWAEQSLAHLRADPGTMFAYNLFSVSDADLERIRALQRSYFRDLRAIVAASTPAQAVALVTMSLIKLDSAQAQRT